MGYWGFHTFSRSAVRWSVGIGAPIAAAAIWALFVAPEATVTVPSGVRIILQVLVFGLTFSSESRHANRTAIARRPSIDCRS